MATVKRAKLRAAPAASASSTLLPPQNKHLISGDSLVDFPQALFSSKQMHALLSSRIRAPNSPLSSTPPRPEEPTPVPLKFDTSSDYLQVFHDLQLEEAQTELAGSLETGTLSRVGFKLILKESYTEGNTRVCRLRAELKLPDRQAKPKKDWRDAEMEQMDRAKFVDKGSDPVPLSSVGRGNVLVLTDKPMVARDGAYYTEAEIVGLALVWKSARPVHGGKESLGWMDIDLAVTVEVAEQINGKVLTLYVVQDGNLTGAWREWDGVNSLFSSGSGFRSPLLGSVLCCKPEPAPKPTPGKELPGITLQFQQQLCAQYNASQMDAIMAAGAKQTGFVLVQGPPGTGKTHTLFGILNALHLSVSQLSYDNVLPKKGRGFDPKAKIDWLSDPTNPHLLICAPSNAAIDNVLRLVTERGFKDGMGNVYKPTCVRIGSATWNRTSNSAASLEGMVDDLMRLRRDWNDQSVAEVQDIKSRLRGLEAEIRATGTQLSDLAQEDDASPEYHTAAGEWLVCRNRARDLALQLERHNVLFSPNTNDAELRRRMRALILTQSNLVFSTLSQCGSPAICEIAPKLVRFQACVIDEAAQCVEPSVLVPLSLGAERCIMVGDPKQLPATVLSETAAQANYEQSMFERLQLAGHFVHLLDTQYRCRPEMSSFSSVQFYQSRLKDGANVVQPTYRMHVPFGPLVFFDVGFGKQRRANSGGGHSLTNEEEAAVCLEVYRRIRQNSTQAQVAVISPYKDQLALLQSRFGRLVDANLEFNTVDGFQGREVDVVIFSCVRSVDFEEEDRRGGGIGFLADARRLNVAVTRAKYNLFLVGNYAVLKSSSGLWSKLLDHVERRGNTMHMKHTQDFY